MTHEKQHRAEEIEMDTGSEKDAVEGAMTNKETTGENRTTDKVDERSTVVARNCTAYREQSRHSGNKIRYEIREQERR